MADVAKQLFLGAHDAPAHGQWQKETITFVNQRANETGLPLRRTLSRPAGRGPCKTIVVVSDRQSEYPDSKKEYP